MYYLIKFLDEMKDISDRNAILNFYNLTGLFDRNRAIFILNDLNSKDCWAAILNQILNNLPYSYQTDLQLLNNIYIQKVYLMIKSTLELNEKLGNNKILNNTNNNPYNYCNNLNYNPISPFLKSNHSFLWESPIVTMS